MPIPKLDWENRLGRRLKLRDLHVLFTIVQWGSMAKGAVHLGMSQPAVSEAIERLEDALCVPLLDRSPRGVEPTMYARALLKRGHVAFDELKQGIREIESLADPAAGEVRVGCPESLAAGFVPAVVERLSRRYPKISVQVALAQPGEQEFRELRERSVDLLLGRIFKPLSDDGVEAEKLFQDEFHVVVGSHSPWANRRKIELADLMDEHWVLFPDDSVSGSYVEKGFQANGLQLPKRRVTSFSMQMRLHLLASGRFVTVLHGSVLRFNARRWSLKTLPVDLRIQPMPVAIFSSKNRTVGPAVNSFIEEARKAAQAMRAVAKRP
jgi:DNA-binding transcriptional LysR family regulator